MQLREFQQHIRDRYFASDNARGAAGTFLWFSEEVGELAHALANAARGKADPAKAKAWPAFVKSLGALEIHARLQSRLMVNMASGVFTAKV